MTDAHVTEIPAALPASTAAPASKFKAAAPIAGAIGIIVAIVTGAVVSTSTSPQPPGDTAISGEISAPLPPPGAGLPPSEPGIPGIQQGQTQPGLPPGMQRSIEIVVKFKDDAKVKDIVDAFWRDAASARTKFDAWKSSRPEFAKLRLDRVTYSSELVLVHEGGGTPAERLVAMREIANKLGAAPDISYAEQNMTAQPGGQ